MDDIGNLVSQSDALSFELSSANLPQLLAAIRTKHKQNAALREQHLSEYSKYIAVEEDLNEDVTFLQRIANLPQLLPLFIQHNGVEITAALLEHPNVDLSNAVVNLIQELTEDDFLNEIDNPQAFMELYIANDVFPRLVRLLFTLNEQSVGHTDITQYQIDVLSILENYIDIYSPSATLLCQQTRILQWLLSVITASNEHLSELERNDLRLFASETLYALLQASSENQQQFAELKALPSVINVVVNMKSNYKAYDGANNNEYIHNVFNCICCALLENDNKELFAQTDGVNVFIDLMKGNDVFRVLSLKVLNYALQGDRDNCVAFIESNGLSVLFAFYMGKATKRIKGVSEEEVHDSELYCLEMVLSLMKYVDGVCMERLMFKFRENRYEKVIRLVEHYYARAIAKEGSEYRCNVIAMMMLFLLKQEGEGDNVVGKIYAKRGVDVDGKVRCVVRKYYEEVIKPNQVSDSDVSDSKFIYNLIN